MAIPVQMPKVGISVESCIITKWHKKKGDKVEKGDILFSYETDKTSVEEESQVSGTLLEIFYNEGDDVPVMQYVAVIGKPGEDISMFAPKKELESVTETVTETATETVTEIATETNKPDSEKIQKTASQNDIETNLDGSILKISPRAKNLATKSGVDVSFASASGAEGRIVEKDIKDLIAKTTKLAAQGANLEGTGIGGRVRTVDLTTTKSAALTDELEFEDVKITNVRKLIADAMQKSLSQMAQLTHNMSFDATSILKFRKKIKQKPELGLDGITINDIILYATSRVLLQHKDLNAHFLGDSMRYFKNVNLGIAVDSNRGLLVPTLFKAEKLSLLQLSMAAKTLVKSAQQGTVSPNLLKGGTFTVTNLGALGVESFTPIINPPQTAILGVNTIVDGIKVIDNQIVPYKKMTLSLTYDHRAIDGAPATKFLKDVCNALENFELFLAI